MIDTLSFYSTTEASRLLGISSRTVQRMCHKGKLAFYQYETKILIPESEIARLLNPVQKSGDSDDTRDRADADR